jgi:4-amino-4-deoxy-L-arabinose transferase-like glycosyltransferase
VVLGLGIFVLWILPLTSSFWLDETVTAWVVQGDFAQTLHRAFDFQPMFPTYYVVAWLAREIGGMHEWVLRLPSVLAMAAATVLVARLGRRLFDRETGILAAIVFATSVHGAYTATDARPYALGILALVIASLLLIYWLDTGDVRAAAGCVIAAAAVVYVHYLLGVALIAHLVYAVRQRRKVGIPALLIAAVGFLALLAPLIPWFLDTYDRRSVLSLGLGSVGELAAAIAPPSIAAALLIGAFFVGRGLRIEAPDLHATREEVIFLGIWALCPPIALLAASHATGVGLFTPRYLSSTLPAISLLTAGAVRMIGPMQARRLIITAIVAVSIIVVGPFKHTDDFGSIEDWRGALATVRTSVNSSSTPVVMQSALIEGQQVALLRDPAWTHYLLAPASVYQTGGQLIPAPNSLSAPERAYLEELTVRLLLPVDQFVLVMPTYDTLLERWLEGRLQPLGFTSSLLGRFGIVTVVEFSRSGGG